MNRTEKQEVVTELASKVRDSAAIFLADYRGLTVAELTEIRTELDKVQARIHIVKNRLMKRALGDEESELKAHLQGPIAITFVEDNPVEVAKVLAKYQKDFESLEIKAGVLKGEVIGAEKVEALSKLPSKEELYATLLATLLAPASNLARVLQGVPEKIARAISAIRDTKEE